MVDGDYIRILGRDSDLINVGGEKVYPAEVESLLLGADNVIDAYAYGRQNPLTGQVVVAEVVLREAEPPLELRRRLRQYCAGKLERYKIPVEVIAVEGTRAGARFKKMRFRPAQPAT